MSANLSDAEVLGSTPTPAAPLANGLDRMVDDLNHAEDDLAASLDARAQARRDADRAQLHLALHDLAEGFRGMIRVAPFASIATAVAVGLLMGRRKRRAPPMRAPR